MQPDRPMDDDLDRELSLLDDLGVDFGQKRSREVLALYLRGLRICGKRRTLANVAAALRPDENAAAKLVDRFNYQLNDRHGRSGASWAPEMMKALGRRAIPCLRSDHPRVLVLVAMYAPRLGRGSISPSDLAHGTAQMVAVLLAVGRGPAAELEAFPIGWRLGLDGWTDEDFERAEVPSTMRYADHLSIPAGSMLADVSSWGLPDLPLVASGPFAELRFLWLSAGWSYVVEWKKPHATATSAAATSVLAQLDAPPGDTLEEEIAERRDRYWRDVRKTTERTARGIALRIDLMSKWRTRETAVQIADSAWCAHLPTVSNDQLLGQILAYDALREAVKPVYRQHLRQIGLDDYRGRKFTGWHAHRALVSAAHLLDREAAWADPGTPHQEP